MTYTFCLKLKNFTLTYKIKQIKKMRCKYSFWCHSFTMTVHHAPFYPMSFLIHSHTCKSIHKYISNNLRTAEQVCMKIEIAEYCQKLFSHFCYWHCHSKTATRPNLVIHWLWSEENILLQFFFQAKWFWLHICLNFLVHLQGLLLITML